MYYVCNENKDTYQLYSYCTADLVLVFANACCYYYVLCIIIVIYYVAAHFMKSFQD